MVARLVVALVIALSLWARERVREGLLNLVDGLREGEPDPWRASQPPVKSALRQARRRRGPQGKLVTLVTLVAVGAHVGCDLGIRPGTASEGPPARRLPPALLDPDRLSFFGALRILRRAVRRDQRARTTPHASPFFSTASCTTASPRSPTPASRHDATAAPPRVVKHRVSPFNTKRPLHANPPKPRPVADTLSLVRR